MRERTRELIAQMHGNASESDRALQAVRRIVDILWPKLTPELREDGYEDSDADEDGFLHDEYAQWTPDTLEDVAMILLIGGFGQESKVIYELEHQLRAREEHEDEDEDESEEELSERARLDAEAEMPDDEEE